ncbi:unnamed protein product [Prorocentrum cordatum]|uniref:Uncharacterized protein n=1 Tax=Prorocentrum cordatum TaxID=2364126 RepID=A0ABN9PWA3_9DINO|nr:unnamed protein product [Polarella glacialis]
MPPKAAKVELYEEMAALAGDLKASDLQESDAEDEEAEEEAPEDEEEPVAKKPARFQPGRFLGPSALRLRAMRRPASAKGAAVRQKPACNLRRPAAATIGDDDEGDGKRSQPKMRKLLQMMDSLPPETKSLWEQAARDPKGRRARETEIVNNLFHKVNGKLVLKLDSPWHQKEIEQKKSKFGQDSSEGIPRSVMIEKFRDGEEGLNRAIKAGGVQEWTVDGVPYCAIRTVQVGTRHDVVDKNRLSIGKNVTEEQAKKIQEAVNNMNFGFQLTKKETSKQASSDELPQKAIDKLSTALCILEKLLKDGEKMFDKLVTNGVPPAAEGIKDQLEVAVEACSVDKNALTKMYRFRKAADNSKLTIPAVQEALATCAVDCEKLKEAMSLAKRFAK